MRELRKIIVFSGSFDPPTLAHQAIIEACLHQKNFNEVWVMPTGIREDKEIGATSNDRVTMLKHMKREIFKNTERLKISDFELKLPLPTQTNRTVKELLVDFPDIDFWFAYGADSYQDMPNWQDGKKLQNTLNILVAARRGYSLPLSSPHLVHLILADEKTVENVSSTLARNNIKTNQSLKALVCNSVDAYIASHGLYATTENY
jgi:nicotinate-nucleotide adenylyltransferase